MDALLVRDIDERVITSSHIYHLLYTLIIAYTVTDVKNNLLVVQRKNARNTSILELVGILKVYLPSTLILNGNLGYNPFVS